MSIKLNDNIKINAGKPSESKYLNTGNTAYSTINAATIAVPISERHIGLTVLINTGSINIEYWWKDSVLDVDLIEKKFSSEQLIGNFVTGATNLGFFSGNTGVQILDLSGFPETPVNFNDTYYSQYNWYYVDSDGVIKIASSTYESPFRRVYVDILKTKSWIYSDITNGWILAIGDVTANVGDTPTLYSYDGTPYDNVTWDGFITNGDNSINPNGSLSTGNTLTIGNPIYAYKESQNLHVRTIISKTPEIINISYDDNFINFSGVTSITDGQNIGSGIDVFTGKTDNVMGFRTLIPSGGTTISEASDGSLIIYSSSEGSSGTTSGIIGISNIGSGVGVYSSVIDNDAKLKSIVGSGTTNVTTSGDTIIVYSDGIVNNLFDEDIIVSIDPSKSFGKYLDGDTIPASGKTANEVIILACFEGKLPTVNLSAVGTDVSFGEDNKIIDLDFNYIINTLNGSVSTVLLEWRRGNTGSWTGLTTDTGLESYSHVVDDSTNRFNVDQFNYRYTVVDSLGLTAIATDNVNCEIYAEPNILSVLNGTVTSPETQIYREKGNVNSDISGSITSQRSLVNITEWTLERKYDSESWVILDSGIGLDSNQIIINTISDNVIPSSATTIQYKITYVDNYTSGVGGEKTITFGYFNYAGISLNTLLTSSQIIGLGDGEFATSTSKTHEYTTGAGEYAYYGYPNDYSDISDIVMYDDGGSTPVSITGAFQKLSDVVVTKNGEVKTYKIYRSNAPEAFSTDVVVFS